MAARKDVFADSLSADRVPVVDPHGVLGSVTRDEYEKALAAGYRFQTPEEQDKFASQLKYGERPIAAGAAGVARGVSVGLSDVVAPDLGIVSRETLKGLEEENPTASTVGDVAGSLVSPVNKLGIGVERGIGAATRRGRIGAKAVSGAAVGSLFGAGNAVSDAALNDHPLTAESLIANAGLGSVLGLAGGGIGAGIEEGASALLPKLGRSVGGAQSILDDIADDAAVKSTRATQAELSKVGEVKLAQVADVLRSRGHLKMTPDEMLTSLREDIPKMGALKGDFLDKAEAKGLRPSFSDLFSRFDDFEANLSPGERKAIAGDLKDAREAFAEISNRPVTATGKTGSGFRAFDKEKQVIQGRAKWAGPNPNDTTTAELKRSLAGVVRDELDRQLVPQLGPVEGKAFIAAKETYGALREAEKLAVKGASRAGGVGLKDLLWGIAGGSLHPVGIATALASKFMREHGQAIIAKAADAVSKSPALATVAASLGKALPNVVPKMGQYGPALMQALQSGPHAALALHLVQSQVDPGYSATATLAGLTPEEPDQHAAALERAHGVASVAATLAKHQSAVDEGIGHIIKGTKPAATTAPHKAQDFGAKQMRGASTPDAHRRRVDEVRQLATNPQALLERVSKNTGESEKYAPTVVSSLTATAQRAVAYLAKEAEEPPKPGPLAREWTPTDSERHVWMRKCEVVTEPMALLRIAAEGRLTRTQLDAVQAVYPALASDIRDRALNALVSGEKMPYRARIMLGMLAGVDADGSMSSKALAANQQAIQNAGKKPSEEMGPPPKSSVEDMTLASRSAMPGEQRALKQGVGNG